MIFDVLPVVLIKFDYIESLQENIGVVSQGLL